MRSSTPASLILFLCGGGQDNQCSLCSVLTDDRKLAIFSFEKSTRSILPGPSQAHFSNMTNRPVFVSESSDQ